MRITLITATLGAGGAERVLSVMANHWAANGRDVTVLTVSSPALDWYALHPQVRRVALDLYGKSSTMGRAITSNVRILARMRVEILNARPDVVVSFMDITNVTTLMAMMGTNLPVIVSERIDPRYHIIPPAWNCLRRIFYRRADAIVVQSRAVRAWASELFGEAISHVIPNPIDPSLGHNHGGGARPDGGKGKMVIGVGRLTPQKGFDLLIEAFAGCGERAQGWSLVIAGEGEERGHLEAQIARSGLSHRIRLIGRVPDPSRLYREADLFVLPSRFEGFPNALLEAMAYGLPVIAADCPSGPGEIIRPGVDGLLVPAENVGAVRVAMETLMGDRSARERLGLHAREISERFNVETIMGQWDALVGQIRARRDVCASSPMMKVRYPA